MPISRHCCEERIQQVVPLLQEQAVMHRENFVKLGTGLFYRRKILVIDDDDE